MAKIYVVEGTKEIMKKIKNQCRGLKGDKQVVVIFLQFFKNELLLEHPPFLPYIMLTFKVTIYIFSEIIEKVLRSLKKF